MHMGQIFGDPKHSLGCVACSEVWLRWEWKEGSMRKRKRGIGERKMRERAGNEAHREA